MNTKLRVGILVICGLILSSLFVITLIIGSDGDLNTAFIALAITTITVAFGVFIMIQPAHQHADTVSVTPSPQRTRTHWSKFSKITSYFLYSIFVVIYTVLAIRDYLQDPTGFADFKLIPVIFLLAVWILVNLEYLSIKFNKLRSRMILRFILFSIVSLSVSVYLIDFVRVKSF